MMKLDNLDEVTALRNYRVKALAIFKAAESGTIDCRLAYEGARLDVFGVISADPIRHAVRSACSEYIAELDLKLKDFGVEP